MYIRHIPKIHILTKKQECKRNYVHAVWITREKLMSLRVLFVFYFIINFFLYFILFLEIFFLYFILFKKIFKKIFFPLLLPYFPQLKSTAKFQHPRCSKYKVITPYSKFREENRSWAGRGANVAGTAGAPPGHRDPERAQKGRAGRGNLFQIKRWHPWPNKRPGSPAFVIAICPRRRGEEGRIKAFLRGKSRPEPPFG